MNEKLWEMAKNNFPDYFTNPNKIAVGFSIAVDRKYRNTKIAQYISETALRMAVEHMGCESFIAQVNAPETIHVSEKQGYQVIAEITYVPKDETQKEEFHLTKAEI